MKKSGSVRNLLLVLVGIIFIVLPLLSGLISGFDENFWVGFAFFAFATAVTVAIILIYGSSSMDLKSIMFHTPIYFLAVYYYGICAVLDFIHMLFGTFSMKFTFIVQILVFAFFAILFVISLIHVNVAKGTNDKVKEKNDFIRTSAVKLNTIASMCRDADLAKALNRLSEEFKYSSPASHPSLGQIEYEITANITLLDDQINANELDEASATMTAIRNCLRARNERVKLLTK